MTSAGNDIVSLDAINAARTKQYKFYSKIISGAEKALYSGPGFETIPFEWFVWLLWSIKESAYKFLSRHNSELIFTPVKFEVKQLKIPLEFKVIDFVADVAEGCGFEGLPAITGLISIGDDMLFSGSLIYNAAIMTVVNDSDGFEHTFWGIKKISSFDHETQSSEVRGFLYERLLWVMDLDNLSITKNEKGVPVLWTGNKEIAIPVSLSHHGDIIAYAFQKTGK